MQWLWQGIRKARAQFLARAGMPRLQQHRAAEKDFKVFLNLAFDLRGGVEFRRA